eukprot:2691520-Prymnesium_polylepis.2
MTSPTYSTTSSPSKRSRVALTPQPLRSVLISWSGSAPDECSTANGRLRHACAPHEQLEVVHSCCSERFLRHTHDGGCLP